MCLIHIAEFAEPHVFSSFGAFFETRLRILQTFQSLKPVSCVTSEGVEITNGWLMLETKTAAALSQMDQRLKFSVRFHSTVVKGFCVLARFQRESARKRFVH
jgi:hypothetical protein